MRSDVIRRLSAITATESSDTREYAYASAILRHTANLRRFQDSLNRMCQATPKAISTSQRKFGFINLNKLFK